MLFNQGSRATSLEGPLWAHLGRWQSGPGRPLWRDNCWWILLNPNFLSFSQSEQVISPKETLDSASWEAETGHEETLTRHKKPRSVAGLHITYLP
jgi:hypothetical protein